MRKLGGYIASSASLAVPTSTTAVGSYELAEQHALSTASKWPIMPSVSNWNMYSNSGYGITQAGGVGRNDGVYVNTSFYFSVSLANIPTSLLNSWYIGVRMYGFGNKDSSPVSQSGYLNDGNFDWHSSLYDYDVLEQRSLLTSATSWTSPSFRALFQTGGQKVHGVAFYLIKNSSALMTDTNYSLSLGSFTMYRNGYTITTSASASTVEEGNSFTLSTTVGTNGRASSYIYMKNAIYSGGGTSTADASDFGAGFLETQYSVPTNGTTQINTYSAVSDGVTEGTQTLYYGQNLYCLNQGTYNFLQWTSSINVTDPPPPPSYLSAGNKTPLFGAGGAASYPPSAGWTGLQNVSSDDAFVNVPLGFSFYLGGAGYTTAYVGSNSYVTFSGGSTNYSGLSASNPAYPKFMLGASDNSYQRVSYISSGANWTKIRYEGNGSTGGTVGTPGITLEITLYNPSFLGTTSYVCEVLVGGHNRLSAQWGVANASTYYATSSYAANSSYVFVGDSTGTTWKIYSNYYVNVTT